MSDKSRRKLLKSIAAGSGAVVAGKSLPESWTRPVVDSVMLPAHAQTSLLTFFGPANEIGGNYESGDKPLLANAMETMVPDAQAGGNFEQNGTLCIIDNGDGTCDVTHQNDSNSVRRMGTLDKGGETGLLEVIGTADDECSRDVDDLDASILDFNTGEGYVEIEIAHRRRDRSYRVYQAGGCGMPPLDGELDCE